MAVWPWGHLHLRRVIFIFAHFNPAGTLVQAVRHELTWQEAIAYGSIQIVGCCAGALLAHAMFELPLIRLSSTRSTPERDPPSVFLKGVATFGLLLVILGCRRSEDVPWMVAAWNGAAYWFTASTSFLNPAITIAIRSPASGPRMLPRSFCRSCRAPCWRTSLHLDWFRCRQARDPFRVTTRKPREHSMLRYTIEVVGWLAAVLMLSAYRSGTGGKFCRIARHRVTSAARISAPPRAAGSPSPPAESPRKIGCDPLAGC